MIRAFLIMAASLALAVLTPAASAQDYKEALVNQGTLTVGTSGSAPPFSMTTPTGDLDGFDIEVAKRLGERWVSRLRSKAGLRRPAAGAGPGRFDIIASGVTRTPERLASTDFFLLSPYIVNGVAVTRRAGEDEITGWDTVCGKVMGAVRGGTFQKIAMEKLPAGCVTSTREYPGATELFLDLRNGRIDFAAHDFLGPNYLLRAGRSRISRFSTTCSQRSLRA